MPSSTGIKYNHFQTNSIYGSLLLDRSKHRRTVVLANYRQEAPVDTSDNEEEGELEEEEEEGEELDKEEKDPEKTFDSKFLNTVSSPEYIEALPLINANNNCGNNGSDDDDEEKDSNRELWEISLYKRQVTVRYSKCISLAVLQFAKVQVSGENCVII